MREAATAGHSVGIHAWDHIDWHDRLPRMSREEIETVVAKEHARFLEIFGRPATFQAAPGWTATPLSVEVQEAHGIVATSDTRGGEPVLRAPRGRQTEPGAGDPVDACRRWTNCSPCIAAPTRGRRSARFFEWM